MFSQELREYITHGREESHIEYKASMKWIKKPRTNQDRAAIFKVVKAMLAMANNPNGGVIVIGEREKGNGEFAPTGVSKEVYDSYKYDDISRYIKGISDPQVQFKITRDEMEINKKKKRFIIIQVTESVEFPIICTRTELYDKSKPPYSDNVVLRENVIYIRTKAPIESREIANVQEWRELIYRIMEKSRKELLKRMPCFDYMKEKARKETEKDKLAFKQQLKKDNL